MKGRRMRVNIVAAWIASLVCWSVTSASFAEDAVKIGVLTDLSGVGSYYGQQTRVGAELAEQELRAAGKAVRIVVEDSALKTAQGVSGAQKLLMVDRVDALYVDFSSIAVAVSSLVQREKKVMVYSAAAESVARNNPFAFKTYSDYAAGCEVLARRFGERGVKSIGVLEAETEYGALCRKGVERVVPHPVIATYKPGELVDSQVLVMKRDGVEAIVNGGFEADTKNMLQAAETLGYPLKVGVTEDSLTEAIRTRFGTRLDGSLTFGLTLISGKLLEQAKRIPGGDRLSGIEAVGTAYVHVKQLVAAAEVCPERAGQCLAESLSRSEPADEIGFVGWRDRLACLRTVVHEFSAGSLREVGTYVSGEY